ncbi:MAG: ABC transporter ATP-binding protein [Oscillospiraceae bacterium]|nr:ABC transporter ATP-binding protein [Oscillospiraceae bacterium]
MTEYENAIEIRGLTKRNDGFTLDNVSFTVPKGCIMGFIGQNGAGKTTTIQSMLNIIPIDSGEIRMLGMDHIKSEDEVKERIGAAFDNCPFGEVFTPVQIERVFRGLYRNWNTDTFFRYIDRFQLPRNKKVGNLSKGMKMKLQIAVTLSHDAELLIMDEATSGLDPIIRNEILDVFRDYLMDGERSILISSHITSDIEKIADCVTFIDNGKLLLTGYKDEILEQHGVIKCTREEYQEFAPEDYISARLNDFGAQIMTADRSAAEQKYSGAIIEKTTLEEIMQFYVNAGKKEWS